ncbi:MAG: hypothetical protein HY863_15775 [Chloroflexi bacterium]|nr:hypothetical protein [Chloroflexota bacterium]
MARQTLTKVTLLGSYPALPIAANAADVAFVAADVTNKEQIVPGGNDLIVVWNTHATNPYTVTFNSVADDKNRTGDITAYSIGAGEIAMFGPFKQTGWMQTDGKMYMEASNAAIKYAVIALP